MTRGRLDLTEQRLAIVESTLVTHGKKLDQIFTAVTKHEGQPVFDPYKILQFVLNSTILLGLLASAIIYIASNIHDSRLAVLEHIVMHKGDKLELRNNESWIPKPIR